MNPVTGNDLLAYQGNAALGLNTDGIANYGDTDAGILNQSVANLAFNNLAKNKAIYDQKIKERDATYGLIASGKLQLDQVRPEDRPKIEEKLQAAKDILLKYKGDIQSDPKRYLEFSDAMAKFNEADVYAKHRFVELTKQEAEAAKTERPDLKEAYQKHIAEQAAQDLYAEVKPFQQQLDGMPQDLFILGQATAGGNNLSPASSYRDAQGNLSFEKEVDDNGAGTTTGTQGKKGVVATPDLSRFYNVKTIKSPDGFQTTSTGVLDFNKILQQTAIDYQKNNGPGSYYKAKKMVNEYLAGDANGDIEAEANKAIQSYNTLTGSKITPIKIARDAKGKPVVDADGNIVSDDTPVMLKAKLNLMGVPFQVTSTAEDKGAIEAGKARAEIGLKGAQAVEASAKAKDNLASAGKTWQETQDLKDKKERTQAQGEFFNTQTMQMFDVNRFTNGQDIVGDISPEQQSYLVKAATKGEKFVTGKMAKDKLAHVIYDYSNIREPKLVVVMDNGGGKATKYTVRPADVRLGVMKSVLGDSFSGKEGDYLGAAEIDFKKRSGSRDINANIIPTWKKERGKVTVEQYGADGKLLRVLEVSGDDAQTLISQDANQFKIKK